MPSRAPLGHSNTRDHTSNARPAGRNAANKVGMEEKRLEECRPLAAEKLTETVQDAGQIAEAAAFEAVDLDTREFQRWHTRRFVARRSRSEAVDHRIETLAIEPHGQVDQCPLGPPHIEIRDAQGNRVTRHGEIA
jgi:hypothetical protein